MLRYVVFLSLIALADEACRSGPQVNERTGPYTSLIAVGPQRGMLHCYI